MARVALNEDLAALATLSPAQLRAKWLELSENPLPHISPALLRLALAWDLQAKVHGGLSRQTQQKLDQPERGRTQARDLRPGTRLAREWNGTLHVVTIDDDGFIEWNGRCWSSLSRVAREITGTRWSGPAFFRLKQSQAA